MSDISALAEFLLESFETLGSRPLEAGALDAHRVPGRADAFVAVSGEREYFVLLDADHSTVVQERRMRAVRVLTADDFTVSDAESGELLRRRFAIVALRRGHENLLTSFSVIVATLLATLPSQPGPSELMEFLDGLAELVAPPREADPSTVVGLWGELWMISESSSPELFVAAWHSRPEDRFDFSFAEARLEVKTTARSGRVHGFGLDQLASAGMKPTYVASLAVLPDPTGFTVIDLLDGVVRRLAGQAAVRISRIVLQTLAGDIEAAQDFSFAPVGAEPLRVLASESIPRPDVSPGSAVSAVRFRVDIDGIEPVASSIESLERLLEG